MNANTNALLCYIYIFTFDFFESAVEVKTEADSNDITEVQYPHNDKPGTGTSGFLWCCDLCIYLSFCHVFIAYIVITHEVAW